MPEFFTLVSPDDARRLLLEQIRPIADVETISTSEALGRVLAEEVASPQILPEFRRSTVDGYAVRSQDTFGASESLPAYLKLIGEAPMGQPATMTVTTGTLVLVHTGGMIPEGADAAVMIENTQISAPDEIEVRRPAAPGENVIQPGEDIQPGDPILPAGSVLRPQDIGGLLAVGIASIRVRRKPRVAIFATGDEVIEPDRPTRPGQVRDINSYAVAGLVERAGGVAVRGGILPDHFETLLEKSQQSLRDGADMLILSAGSSVSVRDMTSEVFNRLGKPGVLAHGVATKPGKPTILGVADGVPVVGLPGNPVSAFVQFLTIGVPALRHLMGAIPPKSLRVRAALTANVASAAGREDYVPCQLVMRDGMLLADPIFFKSNLIFTLVKADGLLVVPLDKTGLEAGDSVEVLPF